MGNNTEFEIVIADDHPIFREGVRNFLYKLYPKAKITEFSNGKDAFDYVVKSKPVITILDIDMPGMSGLEVSLKLKGLSITKVIILTLHHDFEILLKAKENGAKGYLIKENTGEELSECIVKVLEDKMYITKALDNHDLLKKVENKKKELYTLLSTLTQTEFNTLKLVSQKYTSKEIADILFVSVKTVDNYRYRICKKLPLNPKSNSLLLWAIKNEGIIKEFEKK